MAEGAMPKTGLEGAGMAEGAMSKTMPEVAVPKTERKTKGEGPKGTMAQTIDGTVKKTMEGEGPKGMDPMPEVKTEEGPDGVMPKTEGRLAEGTVPKDMSEGPKGTMSMPIDTPKLPTDEV